MRGVKRSGRLSPGDSCSLRTAALNAACAASTCLATNMKFRRFTSPTNGFSYTSPMLLLITTQRTSARRRTNVISFRSQVQHPVERAEPLAQVDCLQLLQAEGLHQLVHRFRARALKLP